MQFTSPVCEQSVDSVINFLHDNSQDAAQSSLELHGHELEANLPLNVYISNPERKKERTDQDANEKEVYVAGLSRFTTKVDLEKLFSTVWTPLHYYLPLILMRASQYGPVKDVRIALEDNGHARGFAFIEFEEAVSLFHSHTQTTYLGH